MPTMSLINEALKKAQHQRGDSAAVAAVAGTRPIIKRERPQSAQTMLLIGIGAILLVVISVVVTVFWVDRPTTKPPAVASAASAGSEAKPATPAVAPAIVPATTGLASTPAAAATTASAKLVPAIPVAGPAVAVAPAQRPPAVATAGSKPSIPPPTTAPVSKPDERVQQFVDTIRVTGIRSSGSDSRVLMNDRVYRVNDIVDRSLELRLTKVASDSLTFTDANGVTYVKYF